MNPLRKMPGAHEQCAVIADAWAEEARASEHAKVGHLRAALTKLVASVRPAAPHEGDCHCPICAAEHALAVTSGGTDG